MSLIMDALEKVQRETKSPIAVAEQPVLDRSKPAAVARPREELTGIRDEETYPASRGRGFFVFIFAIFMLVSAVFGFNKISAGLSMPQMPVPPAPALAAAVIPSAEAPVGPGILRGVLQDPAGSYCILGEQILKTGDTWRGYTVISIEAQQVVVQDTQNHLLTLHLQES